MRGGVDRAGLVDIGAAGIEIADRQRMAAGIPDKDAIKASQYGTFFKRFGM